MQMIRIWYEQYTYLQIGVGHLYTEDVDDVSW